MHTKLGSENLKQRDYSEDLGIGGMIRYKCILWKRREGVDWMLLAQNRNHWQATVNTVMNLQIP